MSTAAARYRALEFPVRQVRLRQQPDGLCYLRAEQELLPYAERLTDRLLHWASTEPERTWMAQRVRHADGSLGDWRQISYGQALQAARSVGQFLLRLKLNTERPVAMLSENDLEHALLALGCMMVGVPYTPVSPAYSLLSQDFEKLRHVLRTVTPGLVFASDAARYARAIEATLPVAVPLLLARGQLPGRSCHSFAEVLALQAGPEVEAACQATSADSIVKFLFTSGSTKLPKAVINTQRMWCANQQQMRQSMPVLAQQPPVLVDWLPWNHTFGGNHNFGLVLYNGGTLYIDEGRPTPALIGETLRNLREIAPTVYFNVPTGFEAIAHAMRQDALLRKTLLSRCRMFFYAGAALAQPIWDALHEVQEQEIGERIVMGTGLGMTESGPFAIFVTNPNVRAGDLGVPTPGLELKLEQLGDKTEVRYRGPNVTPGYWRDPLATREAFDEEGFLRTGDAVRWIDEADTTLGLRFDGRIAEDFKLATGTFVSVGPLRARLIAAAAPYVQDVVITGLNRNEVGAMVFPSAALRHLSNLPAESELAQVLRSAPVIQHFQQVLNRLALDATGSASRIARLILLQEPPSIDSGEVTDKGSINQRAVLKQREDLVNALHDDGLEGIIKPQ